MIWGETHYFRKHPFQAVWPTLPQGLNPVGHRLHTVESFFQDNRTWSRWRWRFTSMMAEASLARKTGDLVIIFGENAYGILQLNAAKSIGESLRWAFTPWPRKKRWFIMKPTKKSSSTTLDRKLRAPTSTRQLEATRHKSFTWNLGGHEFRSLQAVL